MEFKTKIYIFKTNIHLNWMKIVIPVTEEKNVLSIVYIC